MQVAEAHPVRHEAAHLVFEGIDTDSGEIVYFAVDHRPARNLLHAIRSEDADTVEVEPWQVIGRTEVV